jgi:predicted ferric reductase
MSERTKQKLLWGTIFVTTFPFFLLVNKPTGWALVPENYHSIALYFSAAFGYTGVSLLVWELILGTRAISGLFFEDLVSKLWVHRKLGTYGVLLIFLHPILITYSYGESLFYSIVLKRSTEFEEAVTFGRLAFLALLIIWFTSAIVKSKIAYRPWKYIHYLAYPILLASFLHVPDVGSSFDGRAIQFFWYSFILISVVCVILRARHLFGFGKLSYDVVGIKELTEEVSLLRLRPTRQGVEIRTGQYIYIQRSLMGEEHPFTVLDHDQKTGEIVIAFKLFGAFTKKLAKIGLDESLLIDGPYGIFTQERLVDPLKPAVYIAGGIGITPFVKHSLAQSAHLQKMFYANQTRHSAVFREVLKQHLGKNFVDIFSREKPKDNNNSAEFETGYLRKELLEKHIPQPAKYDYFICGPKGMMDAAKESLLELKVPKKQIHIEEFSF